MMRKGKEGGEGGRSRAYLMERKKAGQRADGRGQRAEGRRRRKEQRDRRGRPGQRGGALGWLECITNWFICIIYLLFIYKMFKILNY